MGSASQAECDRLGMSAAQKLAAARAIGALDVRPDVAVTDGRWDFVSPAVEHVELAVKADLRCLSVATASILAKVTRDRRMREQADHYPHLSFDTNKGYPCPVHARLGGRSMASHLAIHVPGVVLDLFRVSGILLPGDRGRDRILVFGPRIRLQSGRIPDRFAVQIAACPRPGHP